MKQNFNNSSKFWQTIRSIFRKSILYYSITSEQWYKHFSGAFNTFYSLPEEENGDHVIWVEVKGVFGKTITRDDVTARVGNLEPDKSAGPDKIITEMLIHANESIIDISGPAL